MIPTARGTSYADRNYSQGNTLTNSGVLAVATHAMSVGALPLDPNGIYMIYGDVNTTNSGMCTSFCGWHTYGTVNGVAVKFAFIGNSGRCACSATAVRVAAR